MNAFFYRVNILTPSLSLQKIFLYINKKAQIFDIYVPPPWGVGHIVFSADPVGIGVATCLHSISFLNGQILAKLTQIYHLEVEKC